MMRKNTLQHIYRLVLVLFLLPAAALWGTQRDASATGVAILCYHRFGPEVADSMTTRTPVFEQQLTRLRQDGYTFVSLAAAVAGLSGEGTLPARAVVLTVDDGHKTVHSDLLPIIRREHLPLTLFIYPSAISNADYAMTWEQIKEVMAEPGVDVQAHTYWHPNFKTEKRRLSPEEYRKMLNIQLDKSKITLRRKLGVDTLFLAWPFGIHDDELETAARAAGYRAALALGEREATPTDSLFALPRYLIVDATGVDGLSALLRAGQRQAGDHGR